MLSQSVMLRTDMDAMAVINAQGKLFQQLVRTDLANARPDLVQISLVVRDEFSLGQGKENVLIECAGELNNELRVRVCALLPACHC